MAAPGRGHLRSADRHSRRAERRPVPARWRRMAEPRGPGRGRVPWRLAAVRQARRASVPGVPRAGWGPWARRLGSAVPRQARAVVPAPPEQPEQQEPWLPEAAVRWCADRSATSAAVPPAATSLRAAGPATCQPCRAAAALAEPELAAGPAEVAASAPAACSSAAAARFERGRRQGPASVVALALAERPAAKAWHPAPPIAAALPARPPERPVRERRVQREQGRVVPSTGQPSLAAEPPRQAASSAAWAASGAAASAASAAAWAAVRRVPEPSAAAEPEALAGRSSRARSPEALPAAEPVASLAGRG